MSQQLFEYTHPIINSDLAISNHNPNPRKFQTLQSWYNVINDYEFKFRCPIILKNSHKNKHFTFACHLKNCGFKILLSCSGIDDFNRHHEKANNVLDSRLVTLDDMSIKKDPISNIQSIVATTTTTTTTTNSSDSEDDEEDSDVETIKKYTHETDPHVTAAIAAAVAAAEDSTTNTAATTTTTTTTTATTATNDTDTSHYPYHQNDLDRISNTVNIIKEPYYSNNGTSTTTTDDDINSLLETSVNFISGTPIIGPFVVTKIFPYHNHALKDNMSLEKFILTKIPKILQNDLNFDTILENLYKKGNHSMNKFKVSLFVTDSGLLDIIKQRYHIDDKSITKGFLSSISRRVTTYKARFVLKKKKMGLYHDQSSNIHLIHHNSNISATTTATATTTTTTTTPANNNPMTDEQSLLDNIKHTGDLEDHLATNQVLLNVTKKILSSHQGDNDDDTTSKRLNDSLLADHTVIDLNNASHVITSDLQNAAQAAINEAMALKRRMTNDEPDLDSYKRSRPTNNNNTSNNNNSTSQIDDINIGDIGDDKLPHEVAEQLRLLSSHFKDVDVGQTTATATNTATTNDHLPNAFDDDDDDDDDDVNLHHQDHTRGHSNSIVDTEEPHILEENIQPELRG